jgi:UDP-N-acetylglucosamine 2-epimerase (non-hydrolysing)
MLATIRYRRFMHVLGVVGARPNFMKMKPVLSALEDKGAITTLVHTGQHYDPRLSEVFFTDLGLRPPDHHLGVGSGTQAEQTAAVMVALEPLVSEVSPDVVVVVGDVNSTMAAAIVAAKNGKLLAHVEAGLRSRDWSMPEEINRVVTDTLSDVLFAPSDDAAENLVAEGVLPNRIHTVGNVMVDTLLLNMDRARDRAVAKRWGIDGAYGYVTLHRPSNVDEDGALSHIVGALGRVAREIPLIFPVHPRTRPRLERLGVPDGLTLTDPLGYLDFVNLQMEARLALTDSGGIQEETTVLGVPCLTLRNSTERPITVSEGTNRIVGTDPDAIVAAASEALASPPANRKPALWDGKAGERIAAVLMRIDVAGRKRPTGPHG